MAGRIESLFLRRGQAALAGRSRWLSDVALSAPRPIRIRQATLRDIPFIDQCNRANLSENYSHSFILDQLQRWDRLSYVAETDENDFVGYALGRVDTIEPSLFEVGLVPPTMIGHIASVAVNEQYRGRGVARQLVELLHQQLVSTYGIHCAFLYVRATNLPAISLYERLGYVPDRLVHQYYADQEDAMLMRLPNLPPQGHL